MRVVALVIESTKYKILRGERREEGGGEGAHKYERWPATTNRSTKKKMQLQMGNVREQENVLFIQKWAQSILLYHKHHLFPLVSMNVLIPNH